MGRGRVVGSASPQLTAVPAAGSDVVGVMLVDAHQAMRDALAGELADDRLDVLVGVETASFALEAAEHLLPDLVVLEVWLPDGSGILLAAKLRALMPPPILLVYTGDSDPRTVHAALAAGVVGYALKAGTLSELRYAIAQVVRGRPYIDPRLQACLASARGLPAGGRLSSRERTVLALVAQGLTNRRIGDRLGIGAETVRTHVEHALHKLGARNRTHAVSLALEHGEIALADIAALNERPATSRAA